MPRRGRWWWARLSAGLRCSIIGALALALVGLTGCSAVRIGYSQAPDLLYWWLDRYVDFDGDQTQRVHSAIAEWFAWHRRTQLPDYAELLARAQKEVLADTTPARICEWHRELVKRARVAYERAVPAAADIVLTISDEQIQHIEKRYAKNNDEFREEYLQKDPAERAKKNLDRAVERAEMLYGRLDDAQRSRLADALARSPFDPALWLAERQERQQDALRLLRAVGNGDGASREEASAELHDYGERLERSPRESYRRYNERLVAYNCGVAAALHNSTTSAQRRDAVKKLAGWESDLRFMIAQANR
jgi:hypothetical protein